MDSFVVEIAFSPDGRQIAIEEVDGERGGHPIDVHRLDGGATRPLVADGSTPSWSPDGLTIAYVGRKGEEANELRIVGADGGGERVVSQRTSSHG